MKKGFTLIELMAVIALLGVIITIASISVTSIKKSSDRKLCEQKEKYITTSAIKYGQEHLNALSNENDGHYGGGKYDGQTICLNGYNIRVSELISKGYIVGDNEDKSKLLIPGIPESKKTFNDRFVCIEYKNINSNKNLDDYASSYNYHGDTNYQVTAKMHEQCKD